MNDERLLILHNEAQRQRALDCIMMSIAFGGDKKDIVGSMLKVHGQYTEGFYNQEFERLKQNVKTK